MVNVDFTPFFRLFDNVLDYIYQLDELFGLFTVIIAMLISIYSYRIYRFTRKNSYFLFSSSFFLISTGFLLRLVFDVLYETETLRKELFLGTIALDPLQRALQVGHMFFVLAGYILLLIVAMKTPRKVSIIIFLISMVALLVSMNYFLTFSFVILIVIATLLLHFDYNLNRARTINAALVWYAFILIFFGYVMQLLIFYSNKFYLLSNFLNIAGFLLLLANFVLVQRR